MTIDPAVIPGLLVLAGEFVALAAVGYVVVRVVLRQDDERMALAQGLVVGLALWGLIVNFVLYVMPGLAGGAVGWGLVLALGTGLGWRSSRPIWPRPRVIAGFTAAVLALFWVALASRQLMLIPDPPIHLGLAATFRAGGFPPELPWNAGTLVRYHHATDLLVGLLAPPFGPDLAFVSELLGAYAWTSFVLVVLTTMLNRASAFAVLVTASLLLTSGLWTFTSFGAGLLHLPVPTGLPEAGLRASLGGVYWPPVELSSPVKFTEVLADIWKPGFPLSYALAVAVLQHAARHERWTLPASITLAGLVGFMGLLSTTLVPVVLVVWGGLALMNWIHVREAGSATRTALGLGSGPVLAGLLLLGGGGAYTGILDGASPSGLIVTDGLDSTHWKALGSLEAHPGGVGVLGIGPVAVAMAAAALARRDRLVMTLATGAGLFLLAWLALDYPPAPWDVNRLAGHARNLALVALLLALSVRLTTIPARWRFVAGALLLGLVVWPTVVAPVRSLGQAVGHGIQLANARSVQLSRLERSSDVPLRRFQLRPISSRVAEYIRNHTPTGARVLATEWPYWNVFLATGRPNNAGFADLTYLIYHPGPEYWDARHYLEPAAFQRLDIEYVHAVDSWATNLPPRARRWLADQTMFELLVRDGDEALYRVRAGFSDLEVTPDPESFEALRSVSPSTVVFLAPQTIWLDRLRMASVLSHTQLVGAISALPLHVRSPEPWHVEPLGPQRPDLVVLPAAIEPWTWMFPSAARQPIWQNAEVAIYAPDGGLAPITPPTVFPVTPPVSVQVSSARVDAGRITFTTTNVDHAPDRWSGQDWVIIEVDDGPWEMPKAFLDAGRGPVIAKWFTGLISPNRTDSRHTYELDVADATLGARDELGNLTALESSDGELGRGTWVLAMRLHHEWRRSHWREVAFIPVLRFNVSKNGEVSLAVFEDDEADSSSR